MKPFKKLLPVLLIAVLVLSAAMPLSARTFELPDLPGLPGFPDLPVLPGTPDIPLPPIATPTPGIKLPLPELQDFPVDLFTLPPISTATPIVVTPLPATPAATVPLTNPPADTPMPSPSPKPKATAKPKAKPTEKPAEASGQTITSEGPPFMVFRTDLTAEPLMFTPMDLSLDGEFRFPLIGGANQVVGEAKVLVQSGVAVVTYQLVNGVTVDSSREFFTFFADIRSAPSVQPADLQAVKMVFGMPYPVATWLNSDLKVLLYINCPAAYSTGLAGLTPFSFQDAGYLARVSSLLPLMD